MRPLAGTRLLGLLVAAACVATSAAAATTPPRTMLDLGDSLSVGTAPFLDARLRGYRVERVHDVGLHAYDAAALVVSRSTTLPPILVVSAGTNDDPRIVSTFYRAVKGIVATAGVGRCVVWPTIARPPAVGASYEPCPGATRGATPKPRPRRLARNGAAAPGLALRRRGAREPGGVSGARSRHRRGGEDALRALTR